VPLEFPLDQVLSDLIDEYVNEFRPVLLRGSNDPWLFPGEAGGIKTSNTFSTQITERIRKAIGPRITAHQFRHAAAAVFLRHRPSDYESVRRLLGHRSVKTTMNFYCGLPRCAHHHTLSRIGDKGPAGGRNGHRAVLAAVDPPCDRMRHLCHRSVHHGLCAGPKLVGKNVGLHPVWLLFAMVAFGYLLGFVGLLVAVPLAAAIAVLLRYWLERYWESPLYRGNPSG
jgi:hypothetical protein